MQRILELKKIEILKFGNSILTKRIQSLTEKTWVQIRQTHTHLHTNPFFSSEQYCYKQNQTNYP